MRYVRGGTVPRTIRAGRVLMHDRNDCRGHDNILQTAPLLDPPGHGAARTNVKPAPHSLEPLDVSNPYRNR
jgi:hypothetical protein